MFQGLGWDCVHRSFTMLHVSVAGTECSLRWLVQLRRSLETDTVSKVGRVDRQRDRGDCQRPILGPTCRVVDPRSDRQRRVLQPMVMKKTARDRYWGVRQRSSQGQTFVEMESDTDICFNDLVNKKQQLSVLPSSCQLV